MLSKAVIGQWYRHLDKGEPFQVIAIDDQAKTVEIQYAGGDLDDIEESAWGTLPLTSLAPPEDYGPPVDKLDDTEYRVGKTRPDWRTLLVGQSTAEPWEDLNESLEAPPAQPS